MAITMRRESGRLHPVARSVAALCFGLSAAWPALADAWRVETNAQANAVASNNVGMANSENAQSDVVLTVTPQMQVTGLGAGYRLEGDLGFDGITYLARTRADHIYPRARLGLNAQLVDRLFYVDTALDADTAAQNPFGVLSEGTTGLNRATITRERISPYIRRELGSNALLLLRSDNSWTQTANVRGTAGGTRRSEVHSHVLRYEMLPRPLGLQFQVTRLDSRTNDPIAANDGEATFDTARLSLLYAPITDLYVGVTGGRDRGAFGNTDTSGTLSGVLLRWLPTPRTDLYASAEKRFFGTGWNGRFTHRSPFMVVSGTVDRDASTYASELASISADSSVASLLDAGLTSRISDPQERQQAVNDAIRQRGLPRALSGAVNMTSLFARLIQRADVSVALLGTRHTMVTRVFQQTTTDLLDPNDTVTDVTSANARQRGLSFTLSRRLTPDTTADASYTYTRVAGFGITEGLRTVNKSLRLGVSHNLSPRSTVAGGVRYRQFDSTRGVLSAQETAVFVGALHRF